MMAEGFELVAQAVASVIGRECLGGLTSQVKGEGLHEADGAVHFYLSPLALYDAVRGAVTVLGSDERSHEVGVLESEHAAGIDAIETQVG